MLCSIYFSLYRMLTLLMAFSPPEVGTTPTILLMRNENSLVDIYVSPSTFMDETCMNETFMDDTFMCMNETCMCMDGRVEWMRELNG
jgi:hypothetical protein